MPPPDTADSSMDHLYPPFAEKVKAVLIQVQRETAGKFLHVAGWKLVEGFRSPARQDWLYAQGRTRPGPIVTYKQGAAGLHPQGLAADLYPVDEKGNVIWDPPAGALAILGHCARANGLEWGGDWTSFKDYPHVQPALAQRLLWAAPAIVFLRKLGLR